MMPAAAAAPERGRARWLEVSRAAHRRVAERFSLEAVGSAYEKRMAEAVGGRYPTPTPRADQRSLCFKALSWRGLIPAGVRDKIHRFCRRARDRWRRSIRRTGRAALE